MKVSKFTLLELLVAIAIIAILASMMLPALGKARAAGRAIKCNSNLKQIALCFNMYANDANGWLPTYYDGAHEWYYYFTADGLSYTNANYYKTRGWPNSGGTKEGQKHIFWCPDDKRDPTSVGTFPSGISYAVNMCITVNGDGCYGVWRRLDSIKKPSQCLLLLDAWVNNYLSGDPYRINYASADPTSSNRVDYRHAGSCNQLFTDMHTASSKRYVPNYSIKKDTITYNAYWWGNNDHSY